MKKVLFILWALFLLLPVQVIAKTLAVDVPLKGQWEDKLERSLTLPVIAKVVENGHLVLDFSQSISNLTVTIAKDGIVLQEKVLSVSSLQVEDIDLSDVGRGVYHLKMTTAKGTMIEGDFVLE